MTWSALECTVMISTLVHITLNQLLCLDCYQAKKIYSLRYRKCLQFRYQLPREENRNWRTTSSLSSWCRTSWRWNRYGALINALDSSKKENIRRNIKHHIKKRRNGLTSFWKKLKRLISSTKRRWFSVSENLPIYSNNTFRRNFIRMMIARITQMEKKQKIR